MAFILGLAIGWFIGVTLMVIWIEHASAVLLEPWEARRKRNRT